MTQQLEVVTKAYDFALWLLPQVAKFPRSHRFTLGERIESAVLDVLGAPMLTIDPDLPGLLEVMAQAGIRPAACRTGEARLAQILQPLCEELDMKMTVSDVPFIDHVRREMGAFFAPD